MNEIKGWAVTGAVIGTFIIILSYIIGLTMIIVLEGDQYRCDPVVRYRIDYIFPARQISCFLYTEVKHED